MDHNCLPRPKMEESAACLVVDAVSWRFPFTGIAHIGNQHDPDSGPVCCIDSYVDGTPAAFEARLACNFYSGVLCRRFDLYCDRDPKQLAGS